MHCPALDTTPPGDQVRDRRIVTMSLKIKVYSDYV